MVFILHTGAQSDIPNTFVDMQHNRTTVRGYQLWRHDAPEDFYIYVLPLPVCSLQMVYEEIAKTIWSQVLCLERFSLRLRSLVLRLKSLVLRLASCVPRLKLGSLILLPLRSW